MGFQLEKAEKITALFSYEKSSSNFVGASGFALSHVVIPLPARSRVGTHPVKTVLHCDTKNRKGKNFISFQIETY